MVYIDWKTVAIYMGTDAIVWKMNAINIGIISIDWKMVSIAQKMTARAMILMKITSGINHQGFVPQISISFISAR